MKLSARFTTVSFLATMALGAAAFAGCTVSTTTSNDTDGGIQNNNIDSGSSSSSDSGTTTDSGTPADSGAAPVCEGNSQKSMFTPTTCQACMSEKCCTEMKSCFNQDVGDGGQSVSCDDYKGCIDDCNAKYTTQQDLDACYGVCDSAANDAIKTAYEIMVKCGNDKCLANCQ